MKAVLINILSISSADVGTRLIGFLAVTYLARTLGPENMGIIAIGLAILTYASIISTMGLPTLGVRSVSANKSSTMDVGIVKQIITARGFLSVISFLLGTFGIIFCIQDQNIRTISLFYLISLFPSALMLDWFFQGHSKMNILAIGRLLGMAIYILTIIVIVSDSKDIYWIPIAWSFGLLIQAIFLWNRYNHYYKPNNNNEKSSGIFEIIKQAIPFGISGFISHSVYQFPIIYLGFVSTPESAGIFSVAFRLVIFLLVLDRVFYTMFFPAISKSYKNSKEKLEKQIVWTLKIVTTVSLFVAVIFFIFSGNIISIIFGFEYYDSIIIFKILLFYFILTFINSVFTFTLIGMQKENLYTKSILIGAVFFIITFLLPTSFSSIVMVAIALVINEGTAMIMMIFYLRKLISINFISRIIFPLLFYIIFLLQSYFFNNYFPIYINIVIILGTLFSIAISSGINNDDIRTLKHYIK